MAEVVSTAPKHTRFGHALNVLSKFSPAEVLMAGKDSNPKLFLNVLSKLVADEKSIKGKVIKASQSLNVLLKF